MRGHAGPLVLERGRRRPAVRAFFEAVQQAGYPLTDDVNGFRQEGFAPFDRTIHRGRRLGGPGIPAPGDVAAQPRRQTRAFVTRILFDGTRAIGVEYMQGGDASPRRAMAGDVVLCGGAINTPQLLQLGVGNAPELQPLGIAWSPTCWGWASTCRTISRCTCSTPARSRSRSHPA